MKYIRKPIEVIAFFDIEGNPSPIKLRCPDEQEETMILKIDKILRRGEEKFAGNPMLIFTCESLLHGQLKMFELRFEVYTRKWFLYKI